MFRLRQGGNVVAAADLSSINPVETDPEANKELIGNGASVLSHGFELAAEKADMLAGVDRALDSTEIHRDQIHGYAADDRNALVSKARHRAFTTGTENSIGVTCVDRGQAHGAFRAEGSAIADRVAGFQIAYLQDWSLDFDTDIEIGGWSGLAAIQRQAGADEIKW